MGTSTREPRGLLPANRVDAIVASEVPDPPESVAVGTPGNVMTDPPSTT